MQCSKVGLNVDNLGLEMFESLAKGSTWVLQGFLEGSVFEVSIKSPMMDFIHLEARALPSLPMSPSPALRRFRNSPSGALVGGSQFMTGSKLKKNRDGNPKSHINPPSERKRRVVCLQETNPSSETKKGHSFDSEPHSEVRKGSHQGLQGFGAHTRTISRV